MDKTCGPYRITFDPNRYSQRVLALILSKAEEWNCSPLQAESRLLNQLSSDAKEKLATHSPSPAEQGGTEGSEG